MDVRLKTNTSQSHINHYASNIDILKSIIKLIDNAIEKKGNNEIRKQIKIQTEGLLGEISIRDMLFKSLGKIKSAQIDFMFQYNNKNCILEIKNQEIFKAGYGCHFDGHGLPPHQVIYRMELLNKYKMIPILLVLEKGTDIIYYNRIDTLEKGEKFYTKNNKRVIYNISSFIKGFDLSELKNIIF